MLLLSNKWYLYLSITKIPTNLRFVLKLYIYINLNWAEQQLFFFSLQWRSHNMLCMTSTGFLLRPASNSRRWCWPSRPSTELHPSTSKHWSDHAPQREHFAHLHQLADGYPHRWEQTQFWHLPSNVRTVESKVSRLICTDFTSTLLWQKCTYCKSLWTKASAKCPRCKCKSAVGQITGRWGLFLSRSRI